MPLLLLFALALPILEIAAMIHVGRQTSVLTTVLLLLLAGCAGFFIISSQRIFLRGRLMQSLRAGTSPAEPLMDSALITMAGFLFIIPGFITDAIGLLLLMPPARHWLAFKLRGHAATRFSFTRKKAQQWEPPRQPASQQQETIIDAEFDEVKPGKVRNNETSTSGGARNNRRNSPWRL